MKTNIISIGNSKGLIIPKQLLIYLDSNKVEIETKNGGLFIKPVKKIREGWEEAAMQAHAEDDDQLLMDFGNEFDKEDWIW